MAARAVITPSEFAKREIVELLEVAPEKVHVIPYGCERDLFHEGVAPADAAALASIGVRKPYLIYVGGFTLRKNVRALLEAWKLLAGKLAPLSLVLVGPAGRLTAMVEECGAPRVMVTGYLDRDRLPAVLKAAEALVFPSIYEGFGMPPLEANALGVPVIAVRAGAVPEVVGDAAVLAADGKPQSLAWAIEEGLKESVARDLRQRGIARAKQFCWTRHAQQVLQIYTEAFGA